LRDKALLPFETTKKCRSKSQERLTGVSQLFNAFFYILSGNPALMHEDFKGAGPDPAMSGQKPLFKLQLAVITEPSHRIDMHPENPGDIPGGVTLFRSHFALPIPIAFNRLIK
jgi:hypothetical protein